MNNFLNKVVEKASWKYALLFSMLFGIFFVLINFSSIGLAGLYGIAGTARILDLEFGFNYETAYYILTALGEDGRAFHLTRIMPLDFPFPFTAMLFLAVFIALLLKHIAPQKPFFKYLLFLPVLYMIFDFVENIGIIALLVNFPDLPEWAVLLASASGMLKSIFSWGSFIAIGILFVIFLYSKFRIK